MPLIRRSQIAVREPKPAAAVEGEVDGGGFFRAAAAQFDDRAAAVFGVFDRLTEVERVDGGPRGELVLEVCRGDESGETRVLKGRR